MEFKKKTLETQIIEIFQKISPAITRLIQSTMNNDKIVLNLGKTKSKNKNEININPSILVNSVSPGFVLTKLTKKILGKKINTLKNEIPLKRLASSKEISKIVLFLVSDQNTYLTGQNVIVDGGFTSR